MVIGKHLDGRLSSEPAALMKLWLLLFALFTGRWEGARETERQGG
jgi:hypothetical protein